MNKNNILAHLYILKSFGYNYINKFNVINNNDVTLPSNINDLDIRIDNCNLCELSNRCIKKVSFSNNLNSNIIIIVKKILNSNEKILLDKMLTEYLDTNINNIVILNIIKCDIKNIEITSNMIDICKDYTLKQIEIIKPKYIFCFGNIYKYITNNNLNIYENIIYNNVKLFYFDELSYLLRNPSSIDNNKSVFLKIKKEMEKY